MHVPPSLFPLGSVLLYITNTDLYSSVYVHVKPNHLLKRKIKRLCMILFTRSVSY